METERCESTNDETQSLRKEGDFRKVGQKSNNEYVDTLFTMNAERSLSTSSISDSLPDVFKKSDARKVRMLQDGSVSVDVSKSVSSTTESLKAFSKLKTESIYNLRRWVRNPSAGVNCELPTDIPKLEDDSLISTNLGNQLDVVFIPTEDEKYKTDEPVLEQSKINLLTAANRRPQIRRNPITGEGIDATVSRLDNFFHSGIRINQPPGGVSSGIFQN